MIGSLYAISIVKHPASAFMYCIGAAEMYDEVSLTSKDSVRGKDGDFCVDDRRK